MTAAQNIIRGAEAELCRPWLRHILSHVSWLALARAAAAQSWVLLAQWADTVQVHALLLDPVAMAVTPISTGVDAGRYPALSPILPGAVLYERMVRDLWGHEAEGALDVRPWLDHGKWHQEHPMAARTRQPADVKPLAPPTARADTGMILPLGPVWGRIDEAAHLRLTLEGPAIRRAESRLGFSHKGTMTLMRGKLPRVAARFAARLSADATVAHSVAFAEATEAACDSPAPPRAVALRIIMMEIERIAGHLDNLAEVGRLLNWHTIRTRCATLREIILRACAMAFGHRLMMDCVVPGGAAVDIADGGAETLLRALGDLVSQLPAIRNLHETTIAMRLSGVGRVPGTLATALSIGGVVGRASNNAFDVRALFTKGYGAHSLRVATRSEGDAVARQNVRLSEIEESLRLVSLIFKTMPKGPLTVALPQVSGEGIGCAESIRGDVWHWLRLDNGQIAAAFPRDPGWALWPLAERVLESATADDVDLVRASFALPVSGMDL